MTETPAVLLATCADVPDLDEDARCLLDALRARGVDAGPAVWTDDEVDWAAADLVLVRTTWDYALQRERYLAWADRVEAVTTLLNPAGLLRWSTDKRYLDDLDAAGVPVVTTHFLDEDVAHPLLGVEHVVKPTVSAGSRDTHRLAPGEEQRSRQAVRDILASGRTVMVQPYLAGVDEHGETALVHVEGVLSHTLRKGPLLAPGQGAIEDLFAPEEMSLREPSAAEVEVGARALAALPGDGTPLYARVDLLPTADGPVLLELELVEPSLFLDLLPEAATTRLADAVLARLR